MLFVCIRTTTRHIRAAFPIPDAITDPCTAHMKAQVRSTHGDSGRHIRVCAFSLSPNRTMYAYYEFRAPPNLCFYQQNGKSLEKGIDRVTYHGVSKHLQKKENRKRQRENSFVGNFYFGCNFCFVFLCCRSAMEIFNFI